MTTEYRRVLALSNTPVKGYFRYRDFFQIYPADIEAPSPPAVMNHHPFVIEFGFTVDESPSTLSDGSQLPQWVINNDDSAKILKEILLLLTVFSNDRLFTYAGSQSWFMPMGTAKEKSSERNVQWGQQGYYYSEFNADIERLSEAAYSLVPFIDENEFFNRYGRRIDQEFDLPQNITQILDAFYELGEDDRDYFLSACTLFSQGIAIWSEHSSLSFAAFVSSIETLIASEHRNEKVEKCSECNQDRYRVVKKFRDFFGKYGSPTPEFRKYAVKVYQYRSKILHRGELFLGEVEPRRFGSLAGFEDDQLRRNIISTCRICFVNWLLSRTKS